MNICNDFNCPNMDKLTGKCKITACSKIQTITIYDVLPEVKTYIDFSKEALIFPHTIGDITFYNKEELIKWVEDQQKFNKDPNYGVGNWC